MTGNESAAGDLARDPEVLRAKLNQEAARASWRELERFFAQGRVVRVDPGMDLLEVGVRLSLDDRDAIERWMREGRVGEVSPDQARQWHEADTGLWALVVAPWVLVQESAGEADPS